MRDRKDRACVKAVKAVRASMHERCERPGYVRISEKI